MTLASENPDGFAELIRQWRKSKGLTQEHLGDAVGLSQHQVSFIENGKSRPSRGAVERMVEALGVPPRDGNRLLAMLGYAKTIAEEGAGGGQQALRSVANYMLNGIDPCPAAVVDERHLMVRMNLSMACFLDRLARVPEAFEDGFLPYPRAVAHLEGMRTSVENWEEFAPVYLQALHRERLRNPLLNEALYDDVLRTPGILDDWKAISHAFIPPGDLVLRIHTPRGVVPVKYITLIVSPPQAHVEARLPAFYFGMLAPMNAESREGLVSLMEGFTAGDVHPALRPALISDET